MKSAGSDRRTGVNSSENLFRVIQGRLIPDLTKFWIIIANTYALLTFLRDWIVPIVKMPSVDLK